MNENKLSLEMALRHSLKTIERALEVEVTGLERIAKVYGSNANSFLVKVINVNGKSSTYFLKFGKANSIKEELDGIEFLQGYLRTPKIILFSKKRFWGYGWILTECILGRLMTEEMLSAESSDNIDVFYELEKRKERFIRKLNSGKTISMDYASYMKAEANLLFSKRFLGEQYRNFYKSTSSLNISSFFDRRIVLNGYIFPKTINQIFDEMRKKYTSAHHDIITAIRGHGDAHHGNILVNRHIWFIDSEYAGYLAPFMELAKPYYNDFIGALFFYYQDTLKQYFVIKSFRDTGTEIRFNIQIPRRLDHRLKITRIKLQERRETINSNTKDFLSLNDYLVLCHVLTKDPNAYSMMARRLFLLFIELLAEFDPFKPESIYSYFRD